MRELVVVRPVLGPLVVVVTLDGRAMEAQQASRNKRPRRGLTKRALYLNYSQAGPLAHC